MSANPVIRIVKPVLNRFPRLASALRRARHHRQARRSPQLTPHGFRFAGNEAMESGQFEKEETALTSRLLEQVDVVVNVGANIGYYCCLALQSEREVIAFEPVPTNLEILYRNLMLNGWEDRVEVFPLALSDRHGIIRIFGEGTGASLLAGWAGASDYNSQLVPTSTLDVVLGSRLEGRRCLFIIDVEGAEKRMLDGAGRALAAEPRPIWMVEITVTEHQPTGSAVNPQLLATFDAFWRHGYEAWTGRQDSRLNRTEGGRAGCRHW
jgi:FkbM family methyltransferase